MGQEVAALSGFGVLQGGQHQRELHDGIVGVRDRPVVSDQTPGVQVTECAAADQHSQRKREGDDWRAPLLFHGVLAA